MADHRKAGNYPCCAKGIIIGYTLTIGVAL
jgi:hypothetical protein